MVALWQRAKAVPNSAPELRAVEQRERTSDRLEVEFSATDKLAELLNQLDTRLNSRAGAGD